MLRLYDYLGSGNGYKVRLLLCQLGIPFERIELDIDLGETRRPDYIAKNPNGRVPLLEIARGDYLAESNAILCYLGEGTAYLPEERRRRASVMQWLFFEQYSHEPNIATPRYWITHGLLDDERRAALPAKMAAGYAALEVMQRHLGPRRFFVGEHYSIADIALYAYTHVAAEGGFDLERFPAIARWLADVAAQPGHVPISDPVGVTVGPEQWQSGVARVVSA
jgi:glutathione S-transferase